MVGDHEEITKLLADAFAELGASVALGDLEAANAGTWVSAVARGVEGVVTPVAAGVKSPPRASSALAKVGRRSLKLKAKFERVLSHFSFKR